MQKSPESAQGTKAPNHSGTNKSGCNCRKQVLWALISSSSALHYEAEFVLASHACHSSHTGILGCCLSLRIPSHFFLRKKNWTFRFRGWAMSSPFPRTLLTFFRVSDAQHCIRFSTEISRQVTAARASSVRWRTGEEKVSSFHQRTTVHPKLWFLVRSFLGCIIRALFNEKLCSWDEEWGKLKLPFKDRYILRKLWMYCLIVWYLMPCFVLFVCSCFFWRTEVTNKTPPSSKNNFNTSIRTAKRILRILPLHVPAAAVASKHSQKRWQLLNTEKMRKNREVGMKSCSTNVLTADMFYSQVAGDLGGIASTSILQSQTTHALHRLSSNHHQPSLTLIKPSPNIIDPQPLVIGEFSHTFRISTTLLHQPWCFSSFHSRNPWSPKTMSRPGQPAPPVPARYAAFPFAVRLCSLLPAPSKKKQFKVNNQKKYDIQKPSHRKFAPRSQICWSIVLRFFSCKFRTSLHQDLALMSASPSWQTWCSAASPSLRSGAGRPGLRSKRQGRKSIRRTSIFTMSHIPNDPIIKVTEHLFRIGTRQESAHIFLTCFSINHQSHLYL